MAKVKVTADKGKGYFHVHLRSPKRYIACRIPYWSDAIAGKISKGAKARRCKRRDGNWETQSVMIKKVPGRTKADAIRLAEKIFYKLENAKEW